MNVEYGNGKKKNAGTFDYFGACDPLHSNLSYNQLTFSLGVFQWIQAKNGSVKRGKVFKRVYGHCSTPEYARSEAKRICEEKNKK